MQVAFYMYTCLSEDPESQRLGFVFILFLYHVNLDEMEFNRMAMKMVEGAPVRISALHICSLDSPQFLATRATALLMMGASNRSRVRFHTGTFTSATLNVACLSRCLFSTHISPPPTLDLCH